MAQVKESRRLIIKNKILTSDDVKNLATIFSHVSNEILEKSREIAKKELEGKGLSEDFIKEQLLGIGHVDVEISASDGSKFAGTVEDIIFSGNFLNDRCVNNVKFYFTERNHSSLIYIRVEHSLDDPITVQIEGIDGTWVNGCLKKFEDFFNRCKDQSTVIQKYGWLIGIGLSVLISFFVLNILDLVISGLMNVNHKVAEGFNIYRLSKTFEIFILSFFISWVPAFLIYRKLETLWPKIELQTGKDYQQLEKRKRTKLRNILITIILPIIISFLPLLFS